MLAASCASNVPVQVAPIVEHAPGWPDAVVGQVLMYVLFVPPEQILPVLFPIKTQAPEPDEETVTVLYAFAEPRAPVQFTV
jgi:hypothetical protein